MEDLIPEVSLHLGVENEERLGVVLGTGIRAGPLRFGRVAQRLEQIICIGIACPADGIEKSKLDDTLNGPFDRHVHGRNDRLAYSDAVRPNLIK